MEQTVNRKAANFICHALDAFICNKELEVFYKTSRGMNFVRNSDVEESDVVICCNSNYWQSGCSEEQKERTCEIIHSCLKTDNRDDQELVSWAFLEGLRNNVLILAMDDMCFFRAVPDYLVEDLRTYSNHENRLIYLKNEFRDDEFSNVKPIKKYKLPGRAGDRVGTPPKLLTFLDYCQTQVFVEKNVIKNTIEKRILHNGNALRISIKKGCELFIDAVTSHGKELFMKDQIESSIEKKHMNYESGAQFYFVGDKVFVEIRIGFQCTIFKVPKRLHNDAKQYSKELDIAYELKDPTEKTQQTM